MYRVSGKDFYFPLVIGLLKISRRFPLRLRRVIIRIVAMAAYLVSRRKRRLIARALDAAFRDELSAIQKRNIAQGAFYQFWRETFWMAPSTAESARIRTMSLRGEEHLRTALSRGKGVILMESNGFGSRVLARRILHAHGYALCQVHGRRHLGSGFVVREQRNWATRRLAKFFEACEMEFLAEIVYLPDSDSLAFTRVLLDRLKRNSLICIAGEGRHSRRLIELPFLGIEDTFSTGMINLARTSGATILPLFCIRNTNGDIEAILESPVSVDSSVGREAGLIAGVREYVSVLERYCRNYPEQYYAWSGLADFRERSQAGGGGRDAETTPNTIAPGY